MVEAASLDIFDEFDFVYLQTIYIVTYVKVRLHVAVYKQCASQNFYLLYKILV